MRKLTLLVVLVAAASLALAQEPAKPASVQSDAQKTAANNIIGLEQQFWEALKNKDVKFLEASVPADLVTISMFGVESNTGSQDAGRCGEGHAFGARSYLAVKLDRKRLPSRPYCCWYGPPSHCSGPSTRSTPTC